MTDDPSGPPLVNLMADEHRAAAIRAAAKDWKSWDLTRRQLCDLELLLNGGFSPLQGFMNRAEYEAVCRSMRLPDGTVWPIPINLDLPEAFAVDLAAGESLALRTPEGFLAAVLTVGDVWKPDRRAEARAVLGTDDRKHHGVANLLEDTDDRYVGGRLEGVELPRHFDYRAFRHTPSQLRGMFREQGWRRVVGFQTRNPMHRAHQEITMRAVKELGASCLIHAVVGHTKPDDVDHYTRVRCYQAVLDHYPQHTAMLSLLPLAMRFAGPREAVWHALIRRNYGCTHFIVGRDHAGPGVSSTGEPFYGPLDAQNLARDLEPELGIAIVPYPEMVYVEDSAAYLPVNEVPEGARQLQLSGTELRKRLTEGREIPHWFTFPEVIQELRRTYKRRSQQGFTVFFTGLSGAGKSTIAGALLVRLLEAGGRPITLLDGDIVRKNLSSELGFSQRDRQINIERIGFVASEITKNGGIALCAPIAPYDSVRKKVREMIQPVGGFVLVHVATALEVCESRDVKGLYAKARAGLIQGFTGIDDPYEDPDDADVVVDTAALNPEEATQEIVLYLEKEGFLGT